MKIYYIYDANQNNIRRAYLYDNQNATKLKISYKLIEEHAVYFSEKENETIECEEVDQLAKAIENHANAKIEFGRRRKYEQILKSDFIPGEYHPRVFRPIITKVDPELSDFYLLSGGRRRRKMNLRQESIDQLLRPIDFKSLTSTINQIELLTNELLSIFQTIHPSQDNLSSYGHRIRNLFIIACTEVEAQLKGILSENIIKKKKRYNTEDYVKLLPHLKLNEYAVSFLQYPEIGIISPFGNWDRTKPTESLFWYKDYNAVKHDRENEFNKSTLINLINSILAIVVLCIAQFGEDNLYMKTRIGNSYGLNSKPNWSDKELYFPPIKSQFKWQSKKILL